MHRYRLSQNRKSLAGRLLNRSLALGCELTDRWRLPPHFSVAGTLALILTFAYYSPVAASPLQVTPDTNRDKQPPNVLVILADDLGYSDLGCYGGEIQTPNLDRLANGGMRFSQFYNTARCWSSRAALMTGYYAQQVNYDNVPGYEKSKRRRPEWAQLLPEVLKAKNYRSFHSGKWHLDKRPIAAGFDRSYSLDDHGRFFSPRNHWLDDKKLQPISLDAGYYATTAVADYAVEFLQQHQTEYADQPFFGFVAFTAPHFPLHALPEDIAKYKDKYSVGWNQLRSDRLEKMQQLGITDKQLSAVEPEVGPPYAFPNTMQQLGPGEVNRPIPWNELDPTQQKFQATKMEIHAAMVDRMDQEIGKILAQLKAMNQSQNTLILFLSDNGASAEIMIRDDGHDPTASPGSAMSHLCLGPGWSNAANTPFRRHKTWVHEGGIHTPMIAYWPAGITKPRQINSTFAGHIVDVFASVLELAELDSTSMAESPNMPRRPGISFIGQLRNIAAKQSLTPEHATEDQSSDARTLWWCHEGNAAIRQGNWKLIKSNDNSWELFDLGGDSTEQFDLAAQEPERVSAMAKQWATMAKTFMEDRDK